MGCSDGDSTVALTGTVFGLSVQRWGERLCSKDGLFNGNGELILVNEDRN